MRNSQVVLETEHGMNLTGWSLVTAVDISADGLTIAGTGTNPAGQIEAWVATIPEPSSGLLAIVVLMAMVAANTFRRSTAKVR